jgi:hypothetical protein
MDITLRALSASDSLDLATSNQALTTIAQATGRGPFAEVLINHVHDNMTWKAD